MPSKRVPIGMYKDEVSDSIRSRLVAGGGILIIMAPTARLCSLLGPFICLFIIIGFLIPSEFILFRFNKISSIFSQMFL